MDTDMSTAPQNLFLNMAVLCPACYPWLWTAWSSSRLWWVSIVALRCGEVFPEETARAVLRAGVGLPAGEAVPRGGDGVPDGCFRVGPGDSQAGGPAGDEFSGGRRHALERGDCLFNALDTVTARQAGEGVFRTLRLG
ncbi:UNVERIFIED_ORG: hypothetical protein ABIB19_001640 [Arthrobacter sp. UYEF10]